MASKSLTSRISELESTSSETSCPVKSIRFVAIGELNAEVTYAEVAGKRLTRTEQEDETQFLARVEGERSRANAGRGTVIAMLH